MCVEPSRGTQSQDPKKNCSVINRSDQVTAQDHLSLWVSNIHEDKTQREKSPLFMLYPCPHGSLLLWTFKPPFGFCS